MDPLTLFTWGYWGWGNATDRLVQAVNAVEAARGFEPPLFVDIRISRSVRAVGFNGNSFASAVGEERYRWMDDLGNLAITEGGATRIKNPASAATLLGLAEERAKHRQRLLFFCACEYPGAKGLTPQCHRCDVAGLVLDEARRRQLAVRVIEWPGGELDPRGVVVDLPSDRFKKVTRSARAIPLGQPNSLATVAGLPWCSMVTVREQDSGACQPFVWITEPLKYTRSGWVLPVIEVHDSTTPLEEVRRRSQLWRTNRGVDGREVCKMVRKHG